jgi:hypothetical protein
MTLAPPRNEASVPDNPPAPGVFRSGRAFRRKGRFDPQPTDQATVLLASYGAPFDRASIAEAIRLSDGGPVAVVTIARVYGSAYGLPNPGLLPTKAELDVQDKQVRKAVAALERAGLEAPAQVAVSRKPAKSIAGAARARGVHDVVLCVPPSARWRQVVEGDPVKEVRRKLGSDISVTRPA